MTALSLPNDGWREHAVALGWAAADLDWLEQLACIGPGVDEVLSIEPDEIVLRRLYGGTWSAMPGFAAASIERAIAAAKARGVVFSPPDDPADAWCPVHVTLCGPVGHRCGALRGLFWHHDGDMACRQLEVATVGRTRAVTRPCGKCVACLEWARGPALQAPVAAAPKHLEPPVTVRDDRLLASQPAPAKKPKHGKYAALQIGLLGVKPAV